MLGKILKLFVGNKSKKDLKEINPIINQIHSYQDEMNKLSNNELRQKTEIFKKLIKDSISEINIKKCNLYRYYCVIRHFIKGLDPSCYR